MKKPKFKPECLVPSYKILNEMWAIRNQPGPKKWRGKVLPSTKAITDWIADQIIEQIFWEEDNKNV
jgi:hypothetical protein